VSGQNVGFVLAVVGVGLRRLRPWWRLGATWAVIAWFVVLTRVEPSVVRAGTMAALSALAFAMGRERSVARLLAVTVTGLVLVDPLLVWSVGFWLSVTATAGVCVVGPWLEPRLGGPAWLAAPLAVTLGAQAGVIVPSWLVFGRMPSLGIVANLLAVPVAGFVMLYGIPAAIAASILPGWAASVVMLPASLGTRWVRTVAALGAEVEPQGAVAVAAWATQVIVVIALLMVGRARR
jgi:competence protein ComEC